MKKIENPQCGDGIFDLPYTEENSQLVIIPVPWEATTSYGSGCAQGPEAILNASPQLDLYDLKLGDFYQKGIYLQDINPKINDKNTHAKSCAQKIIKQLDGAKSNFDLDDLREQVNKSSLEINAWVKAQSQTLLNKNKVVGLIGGDHSCPEGLIDALCEKYNGDFGILHIDAHADLRNAYQGFKKSHASIMRNAMELPTPPKQLVSVAIRDFCEEEYSYAQSHSNISTYYDLHLQESLLKGQSWDEICKQIVKDLPEKVYVSFDIDGLSPEFCPHTGTPVPGGLNFQQAIHLLHTVIDQGKTVIGFDLCEVAPDLKNPENEWDGNVGARILYKLCGLALQGVK